MRDKDTIFNHFRDAAFPLKYPELRDRKLIIYDPDDATSATFGVAVPMTTKAKLSSQSDSDPSSRPRAESALAKCANCKKYSPTSLAYDITREAI